MIERNAEFEILTLEDILWPYSEKVLVIPYGGTAPCQLILGKVLGLYGNV